MIKLLFSEKQILIASLVLILLANTTNLTFPNAVDEKTIMDWGNTVEAAESDAKQICKDYDGEWKNDECKFEKDSKYPKEQNQEDFEHYMEDHDLWDDYAATQQDKKIENACDMAV